MAVSVVEVVLRAGNLKSVYRDKPFVFSFVFALRLEYTCERTCVNDYICNTFNITCDRCRAILW